MCTRSGRTRTIAWLPATTCSNTSHSNQPSTPSSSGVAKAPGRQRGRANRSMPGVAKLRATSIWSSRSRLTATCVVIRSAGQQELVSAAQKETTGGSSETEVSDVAVNPAGGAPGIVTTATVAAWFRNSVRRAAGIASWSVRSPFLPVSGGAGSGAPGWAGLEGVRRLRVHHGRPRGRRVRTDVPRGRADPATQLRLLQDACAPAGETLAQMETEVNMRAGIWATGEHDHRPRNSTWGQWAAPDRANDLRGNHGWFSTPWSGSSGAPAGRGAIQRTQNAPVPAEMQAARRGY